MQDYGLVSVVMPSYNYARFIGATIEAILAQTYRNWELLITDDCSTDNSREIVRHLLPKIINVIQTGIKTMKVTMIGASGFVGTRLLGLLAEEPEKYECKNVDLLPSRFFNERTVIGDVRVQAQMDRELSGTDAVVLLAAQHRDDVSPVSLYYDTNVIGFGL